MSRQQRKRSRLNPEAGMTLLELIIACSILIILSPAALPVARYSIIRSKETELRRDLREMKDAIDRYKDTADQNLSEIRENSTVHPGLAEFELFLADV
jgi:general secretion pathway protein G